eukprot:1194917-Prorocentrum_minimum.AAC.3
MENRGASSALPILGNDAVLEVHERVENTTSYRIEAVQDSQADGLASDVSRAQGKSGWRKWGTGHHTMRKGEGSLWPYICNEEHNTEGVAYPQALSQAIEVVLSLSLTLATRVNQAMRRI